MHKTFALAEVKTVDGKAPTGEFEAVLSAPTLDRDGEVIDSNAFAPLPASIPVHAFHDFHDPVGRGVPTYEDGVLMLRGTFASTPRAQEIRTLVAEGVISSMSVGYMSAQRVKGDDGLDHVTKGEILEGSFVSIPSNREAAVLMAKSYADHTPVTFADIAAWVDAHKSAPASTGVAPAEGPAGMAAPDAAAPTPDVAAEAEPAALAVKAQVTAARLRAYLLALEGE